MFNKIIQEALGESVEEKMIRLGLLEKKDGKVILKINEAKEIYKQKTGRNPDLSNCKFLNEFYIYLYIKLFLTLIKAISDDIGFSENPIEKGNRESVAQLVRQQY